MFLDCFCMITKQYRNDQKTSNWPFSGDDYDQPNHGLSLKVNHNIHENASSKNSRFIRKCWQSEHLWSY